MTIGRTAYIPKNNFMHSQLKTTCVQWQCQFQEVCYVMTVNEKQGTTQKKLASIFFKRQYLMDIVIFWIENKDDACGNN